ncbi:hypothetical protein Q3G72_028287 [Acer saccharum]|nr:hypothetical protein Q3G72_028287 [Acer saccharum]
MWSLEELKSIDDGGSFDLIVKETEKAANGDELKEGWKDALKEAANLSGFDSGVYKNECELIEAIVQDVSKRLNDQLPSTDTSSHHVGIHSDIESLLCLGPEDVKWIESQRNRDQSSHLQANWPMKTKHNTPRDAYHVLLITAAVILAITFYAALIAPGKLVDNIKYKSSSSLGFQVGEQSSNYLLRLFIWFDSIAFITSAASMIIILMHEIPLKPWMLISVLSIYGAYTCLIIAVSPRDALPVFLLGSTTILLASMSKHLAPHTTLLKPLQFLWFTVKSGDQEIAAQMLQECPEYALDLIMKETSPGALSGPYSRKRRLW